MIYLFLHWTAFRSQLSMKYSTRGACRPLQIYANEFLKKGKWMLKNVSCRISFTFHTLFLKCLDLILKWISLEESSGPVVFRCGSNLRSFALWTVYWLIMKVVFGPKQKHWSVDKLSNPCKDLGSFLNLINHSSKLNFHFKGFKTPLSYFPPALQVPFPSFFFQKQGGNDLPR